MYSFEIVKKVRMSEKMSVKTEFSSVSENSDNLKLKIVPV